MSLRLRTSSGLVWSTRWRSTEVDLNGDLYWHTWPLQTRVSIMKRGRSVVKGAVWDSIISIRQRILILICINKNIYILIYVVY